MTQNGILHLLEKDVISSIRKHHCALGLGLGLGLDLGWG